MQDNSNSEYGGWFTNLFSAKGRAENKRNRAAKLVKKAKGLDEMMRGRCHWSERKNCRARAYKEALAAFRARKNDQAKAALIVAFNNSGTTIGARVYGTSRLDSEKREKAWKSLVKSAAALSPRKQRNRRIWKTAGIYASLVVGGALVLPLAPFTIAAAANAGLGVAGMTAAAFTPLAAGALGATVVGTSMRRNSRLTGPQQEALFRAVEKQKADEKAALSEEEAAALRAAAEENAEFEEDMEEFTDELIEYINTHKKMPPPGFFDRPDIRFTDVEPTVVRRRKLGRIVRGSVVRRPTLLQRRANIPAFRAKRAFLLNRLTVPGAVVAQHELNQLLDVVPASEVIDLLREAAASAQTQDRQAEINAMIEALNMNPIVIEELSTTTQQAMQNPSNLLHSNLNPFNHLKLDAYGCPTCSEGAEFAEYGMSHGTDYELEKWDAVTSEWMGGNESYQVGYPGAIGAQGPRPLITFGMSARGNPLTTAQTEDIKSSQKRHILYLAMAAGIGFLANTAYQDYKKGQ